jgi:hypothetical protein
MISNEQDNFQLSDSALILKLDSDIHNLMLFKLCSSLSVDYNYLINDLNECYPSSFSIFEISSIFAHSFKSVHPESYRKIMHLTFSLIDDPITTLQDFSRSLLSLQYQLNKSSDINQDNFKNTFNTFFEN